jgi:myo-inositol-1(or 4)-monophosphatase
MDRFELASRLILEAGELLRTERLEDCCAVEKTTHQDMVTRFDRETEQLLRSRILDAFPDDAIVGEEYPRTGDEKADAVWYIDPIDGTTNFINQRRNFAVSIGCYEKGKPSFGLVLDVVNEELYSARKGEGAYRNGVRLHTADRLNVNEMLMAVPGLHHAFLRQHPRQEGLIKLAGDLRGVRCMGSVALELCSVAAGEIDLFATMRSSPWDHNAARLIVTEAGGCISALDGEELPSERQSTVLAGSSKEIVEHILKNYLP